MAEATATCRRELDLEIPADEVSKKMESVAKEFARVARVPGFRPGKAPVSLIRRRFAEDIKGEVVQSLVPQRVEQAVSEQKLTPVSQPHVEKLDFSEGQPLKFRAVFEVLPEFEVKDYKGLQLEMPVMDITDEDVTKTLVKAATAITESAEMKRKLDEFGIIPIDGGQARYKQMIEVDVSHFRRAAALTGIQPQ